MSFIITDSILSRIFLLVNIWIVNAVALDDIKGVYNGDTEFIQDIHKLKGCHNAVEMARNIFLFSLTEDSKARKNDIGGISDMFREIEKVAETATENRPIADKVDELKGILGKIVDRVDRMSATIDTAPTSGGDNITMTSYGDNNVQIGKVSGGSVRVNYNGRHSSSKSMNPEDVMLSSLNNTEKFVQIDKYFSAVYEACKALSALNDIVADIDTIRKIKTCLANVYVELDDNKTAKKLYQEAKNEKN